MSVMSEEVKNIDTGSGEIDRTRGKWFVVQVLSGHENKIRETMVKQLEQCEEAVPVYEVFIPTTQVFDVRNGRKKVMTKKIFPGYLWIRMDLYEESGKIDQRAWFFVRSVQGVLGFLGGSEKPVPLTDAEVSSFITPVKTQPRASMEFKMGQRVRIADGPFINSEGEVVAIDNTRCLLTVRVQVFDRPTQVDCLEFWQVEAV